jgi:hypothetical protein
MTIRHPGEGRGPALIKDSFVLVLGPGLRRDDE